MIDSTSVLFGLEDDFVVISLERLLSTCWAASASEWAARSRCMTRCHIAPA